MSRMKARLQHGEALIQLGLVAREVPSKAQEKERTVSLHGADSRNSQETLFV